MTDLIKRLSEIPDVYDDFVLGVINYAKRSPEHIELLNCFMDDASVLETSDIIEFIIKQPDFHEYSATIQQKVG
ncbi:MAG: hypothetical protein Q4D51_00230 [Eubacteriales bacterium]|nr:hypothetical protein [Eubacteriales bacterium]